MNVDFRTRACPKCSKVGGIVYEPISSTYRCRLCNATNLKLEKAVHPGWSGPKSKGIKQYEDVQQAYPTVPQYASPHDVVEEYCIRYDNGRPTARILTARIYCPRDIQPPDDGVFDPTSNSAQFAAHVYEKAIANRRRYQKDRERRMRKEIEEGNNK